MREALQRGVAARPTDAVERGIAQADGDDEAIAVKPRQDHATIRAVQAVRRKRALQPAGEQLGDARAAGILDEDELAIADLLRDARKHIVELRKILIERLHQ